MRPPNPIDEELRPFEPAENAPALRRATLREGTSRVEVRKDLKTGRVETERYQDDGRSRIEDFGWEYGQSARRIYAIHPDDPLSPEVRIRWRKEFGRDGFAVHIDARTHMTVTASDFLIKGILEAFEEDVRVFSREWDCRIPRDHV